MLHRFTTVILILLTGFIFACSGTRNPVQPENLPALPSGAAFEFTQAGENTLILGAWEIYIDPENLTVEAIPLRSAEQHFDVSPLLKPPNCYDCFLAKNLSFDAGTSILTVDIGFRNPSGIIGYDVRGIITYFGNKEFLNPDGYTLLFSPGPQQINPFVAYDTGIGNREFPGHTDQYETLDIYVPDFPQIAPFTYVVEASWPDNCKEPYEVKLAGISGSLFNDGSNAPLLQVYARDWQDDVATVTVDLGPIGGTITSLSPNGSIPDVWDAAISCSPGTPTGQYELLVTAVTSEPFDQTDSMFNYVMVNVTDPPAPGTEIFNPPERVATTPGESFVWPKHSIAVTSDDVSHVVFIDNMPDPESNLFHVYYVNNDGGVWNAPVQIDKGNGYANYATIAAGPDDTLHVVWEDARDHVLGSDIYYVSSLDGFLAENIIVTGDDGYRNVHPRIVVGNDGNLHVAWHSLDMIDIGQYEYDVWYIKKSAGNPSWDPPVTVASEAGIVEAYPSVAPGPLGAAYIAYQSDTSGTSGVYFNKNTSGTFDSAVTVTISDSYQPAMDVAPDGTILIAFFDYLDGTYTDIYLRSSFDQGDTWSSPTPISSSQDAYQYSPDVECTPEGDYHVSWHEEDEMGRPGRVYYREFLASDDWLDIIELVSFGGMGAFPSMDSDAAGHIHVTYMLYTLAEPPGQNNYEIWYRDSVP